MKRSMRPEIRLVESRRVKGEKGVFLCIAHCRGSWLTYEHSKTRIWVMNLETPPEERRRGQAKALVKYIKMTAKAHGLPIDWGVFTEDGKKYIEPMTKGD